MLFFLDGFGCNDLLTSRVGDSVTIEDDEVCLTFYYQMHLTIEEVFFNYR